MRRSTLIAFYLFFTSFLNAQKNDEPAPIDYVNSARSQVVYDFLMAQPDQRAAKKYISNQYLTRIPKLMKKDGRKYVKTENYLPEKIDYLTFVISEDSSDARPNHVVAHLKVGEDKWQVLTFLMNPRNHAQFINPPSAASYVQDDGTFQVARRGKIHSEAQHELYMIPKRENYLDSQIELVDGFSSMVVELLKNEKFKLIEKKSVELYNNTCLENLKVKQKNKRAYMFLFITHKDNPAHPRVDVIQEDLDQVTTMDNFFEVHNWDSPAVPKDIKIFRARYLAQTNRKYELKICNRDKDELAYGYYMLFERKM